MVDGQLFPFFEWMPLQWVIGFQLRQLNHSFSSHQPFNLLSLIQQTTLLSLIIQQREGKGDEMEKKFASLEWKSTAAEEPPAHNPLKRKRKEKSNPINQPFVFG